MASEWPVLSLSEANIQLIDCEHRTPPAAEVGYPYVAIPQLRNGCIDLSDVRLISHEHFVEWTRKAKPFANDVVLSRRCNPGETAFVPPGLEFALGQNLVLLRADGTKVYPPFLRWLVRGPEWWVQINKFLNVGAVFDSLKCADVPNFRLHLPPLPVQRAIAHILGTLDDKIELNRRMNETLEAIARALFKSWFVDFDPVRAKAEGRPPAGMDAATAALFPDAFEESELGEIPAGWRVAAIGDLVTAVGGGTPSTKEPSYWDGDIHFATPKDMSALTSPALIDTERTITEAGLQRVSSGLLPKGAVLLSSRAPIGYLAIAEIPVAVNQGFIAMICDKELPNYYVLHWTRANMDLIVANANGTTFLEISKRNFRPIGVVVPPSPVLEAFVKLVEPLHRRVVSNLHESRTLAVLRDTLLPKLLSGGISVGDAAETLEATR